MTAKQIELEAKVAMLERTVDALSGELHQHRITIEALEVKVRAVIEQLQNKSSDSDLGPHDSPPPHYQQ